jgi:hypothetical protein
MASEACPVCCLILSVETPARVALVAKPARKLWPEYPAGSNPNPVAPSNHEQSRTCFEVVCRGRRCGSIKADGAIAGAERNARLTHFRPKDGDNDRSTECPRFLYDRLAP